MSSGSAQPSASGSASASGSRVSGSASSNSSSTSTSSISIPGTAAAGGVYVTQPPTTASASYYKIASEENITFGWNLTSLYVQPKSLTVIASCSANGNTYPVGPTGGTGNVLPGNATQVIWNPWQAEQVPGATPFAQATYVLKIWDERGPGVPVKGGYLSDYSGTQFAMYRPGSYTPLASGWTCTTCDGHVPSLDAALSALSEPAGIMVFTSLLITLFTAWNILRR
ncbi:hypothetical protein M231_06171 [Tremella mesenterica]|uniref:DUF7137 domain-containing protein n=1 Tax=Tremella mesenterica TaxID=5217 RepID=A0A4Q1BGE1_TREME|nr:uncharacterized protein TREMEDRAFT_36520 [Tremella mesenterica DSM 1558]EIW72202.1 hypothetical protein TREMEDRAFT_36520 [Tremella mesenterica DSM 1558]RXK36561.1 hypothetical protein M231_06171 [Tremella mesenterica]